jgi:hypothetical protein
MVASVTSKHWQQVFLVSRIWTGLGSRPTNPLLCYSCLAFRKPSPRASQDHQITKRPYFSGAARFRIAATHKLILPPLGHSKMSSMLSKKGSFDLVGRMRGLEGVQVAQEDHTPFERLNHQGISYIAFFISLNLSITSSGVDLPVAPLQLPS